MQAMSIYAVMNNDNKMIANFFMGFDDAQASKFMVESLDNVLKNITDEIQKNLFLENVRVSSIVKIGEIDLISHNMINNFNVLVSLHDYKLNEEVIDNEV